MNQERKLRSLIKLDSFVMLILTVGALGSLIAGVVLGQSAIGIGGFFLIGLVLVWVAINVRANQSKLADIPVVRQMRRKKASRVMSKLARDFDGTTIEDETGLVCFSTVIGGQVAEFRATESNLLITSVLPIGLFRLFVCPEAQLGKAFRNVVDVEIGVSHFDRRFAIQTNESRQARGFLNRAVVAGIEELADLVEPAPFGLSFNAGRVQFSIPLLESPKSEVVQQCIALLELIQQELGVWSGEAVIDILPPKKTDDVASCLVCGDHIEQEQVECSQCKTAHHRECWLYIGHCSVFGCGSTQFDSR